MAELDEESSIRATPDNTDVDISDEVQDFRFLASLSATTSSHPTLPRRGEKDFETHGTIAQSDVLTASRQAMHDALSVPRVHNPKGRIVGFYDPSTDMTTIEHEKGQHFKTMGRSDASGRLSLLPEEALYLVERGSLELRWRCEELEGLPLSLQAAYTYLLGSHGLTLEHYTVYAGLKRSGYSVLRASREDWALQNRYNAPPHGPPQALGIFARLYASIFPEASNSDSPGSGPLVRPGLFRSYAAIFRQLALIPYHDPTLATAAEPYFQASQASGSPPSLLPFFHVWKPSNTTFRKSNPPPPDFYIAVMNARDEGFPSYDQLHKLLQYVPYSPPTEGTHVYGKLRQGYRSVVLAVVDQGVTSFVRVGDACFGKEKVWDRPPGRGRGGGKGGGRGRGGGRARGRER